MNESNNKKCLLSNAATTATNHMALNLRDSSSLKGADIAKVLTTAGPVVKAVLLCCSKEDEALSKDDTIDTRIINISDKKTPFANHDDAKISSAAAESSSTSESLSSRVVLTHLIKEIDIDTTPHKSMVAKTLGGPFTFLGQYEEEGIVLMGRNLPDDLQEVVRSVTEDDDDKNYDHTSDSNSLIELSRALPRLFKASQLKVLCHERDIDTEGMLEKTDLVQALLKYQENLPPYNPHQLQPPLHHVRVRGDILCLKVAETAEDLDVGEGEQEEDDDDDDDTKLEALEDTCMINSASATNHSSSENTKLDPVEDAPQQIVLLDNDEFFLDYTKIEYIRFASRTDIPDYEFPAPVRVNDEEEEIDDEEEEIADDDNRHQPQEGELAAFTIGEDGDEIDEEDKSAVFNLVMNEVLRQYRHDNGRGPNTRELLELRANIAKELDVKVAQVSGVDWEQEPKKRTASPPKKIAFQKEEEVKEFVPDESEYKYDSRSEVAMRKAQGQYSHVDSDDDDDDEGYLQTPAKRMKRSGMAEAINLDENMEEDSKPAAVEKVGP